MLVYPVGLPVSTTAHDVLTRALAEHRLRLGTWRKLSPARQALLVLAHLHDNVTYTALAAGFGVGVATVYRYVVEACQVLAAMAPTLDEALQVARSKAYVVLDGTVIETDRVRTRPKGADRSHYSGKIHRHGMNVQVIASCRGDVLWCSPAVPGARHDIRAAREHKIPDALAPLTAEGVLVLADKGYTGIGAGVTTPVRAVRRRPGTGLFERRDLSANERAVNTSQARLRARGERANAQLKTWRVLRRYRGCPHRLTTITTAVWMLITAGQSPK